MSKIYIGKQRLYVTHTSTICKRPAGSSRERPFLHEISLHYFIISPYTSQYDINTLYALKYLIPFIREHIYIYEYTIHICINKVTKISRRFIQRLIYKHMPTYIIYIYFSIEFFGLCFTYTYIIMFFFLNIIICVILLCS